MAMYTAGGGGNVEQNYGNWSPNQQSPQIQQQQPQQQQPQQQQQNSWQQQQRTPATTPWGSQGVNQPMQSGGIQTQARPQINYNIPQGQPQQAAWNTHMPQTPGMQQPPGQQPGMRPTPYQFPMQQAYQVGQQGLHPWLQYHLQNLQNMMQQRQAQPYQAQPFQGQQPPQQNNWQQQPQQGNWQQPAANHAWGGNMYSAQQSPFGQQGGSSWG